MHRVLGVVPPAHTLLGNARSLGLQPMSQMCEQLEGRLHSRASTACTDAQGLALLRRAGDAVAELLDDLNAGRVVSAALATRFGSWRRPCGADQTRRAAESARRAGVGRGRRRARTELREIFMKRRWIFWCDRRRAYGAGAQPLETGAAGELGRARCTRSRAARMAGMRTIGELAHNTESLLTKIERGVTPDMNACSI